MLHLPLALLGVQKAMHHTMATSVLGKRDLKSGFHHIVSQEAARKFMGFQHPITGQIGRWVVLPFGAAQSPAICCEMTSAAFGIFNAEMKARNIAAHTLVYVDDFLIVGDSHQDVKDAFDVMDEIGSQLGISWGPEKDVGRDKPCTFIEFLGVILNTKDGTLTLPIAKAKKYEAAVAAMLQQAALGNGLQRKAVESLTGQLSFAA